MGINLQYFIVEQTLFVTINRTIIVSFLLKDVIITSREHAQLKTVHAGIWQFI